MPNVEVNCTVSNCVFHAKGNVCGAEKILVDMDRGSRNKNTEFASDFDLGATKERASNSADTCCQTFEPKEENEK